MKIFLVDKSAISPTAKIVAKAIEDHANTRKWEGRIECQVINPLELEDRERFRNDGSTVLVSSGEAQLSHRSPAGAGPRQACQSLALAQGLATAHKVYLLRHSDTSPFCGVDLVAALLSGLAGILDDRELLRDAVITALTAHVARDRRHASMLAIGRYAAPIHELKVMLDTWDTDVDWDPTLDPSCWRAATALAQLDELIPIRGIGDRYSFVKLARGLNLQTAVTSFHLSESDLRKVLSRLASLWIRNTTHQAERVRLPAYARAYGFPQNQPVINGVNDGEVARRLYDAAKEMDIMPVTSIDGLAQRLIRLPIRFVNQIQRVR